MRQVYFDLETGGTDLDSPIIQIAAIATDGEDVLEEFEVKIEFDEADATKEALEINSYDPEVWKEHAVPEKTALTMFGTFCKGYADLELISKAGNPYYVAQLVGHNAAKFDGPMIQHHANKYPPKGIWLAASFIPRDTMQLAQYYQLLTGTKFPDLKLTTIANYFGVEEEDAHDALVDVRMTHNIEIAMLDELQRMIEECPWEEKHVTD